MPIVEMTHNILKKKKATKYSTLMLMKVISTLINLASWIMVMKIILKKEDRMSKKESLSAKMDLLWSMTHLDSLIVPTKQ
jgi:hypothetical protein